MIMCVSLLPQAVLRLFDITPFHSIGNCTFKNYSWLQEYYNGGRTLWVLESIRLSSLVLETGFFQLILLYLIEVYTTVNQKPIKYHPIFKRLSLNIVLSLLIFVLNLDDHTFMFGQILYAVVLPIYAVVTIKYARRLSMVLGWRHQDAEYIYSQNNAILLNEERVILRYRRTIVPLYLTLLIVSLGQVVYIIVYVLIDTILQNPCWFTEIYRFSYTNANTLLPNDLQFYWTSAGLGANVVWLSTGMIFFWTIIVVNIYHFVSEFYQEYKRRKLFKDRELVRRLIPSQ
ncbi:hypothetical protein LOD99_11621 [Oopsacas minuta]|uniref:Uncharacterized protein n=1 Tax=Oopsacas minuta TaxID=111878 RepID=A0AAV7JLG3_9METZ|nr:hypothetical protein LOD99_11621 [Oopsacas minuta]